MMSCPTQKDPSSSTFENYYRPISMTPVLSKVFQRRLVVHLGQFKSSEVCFQPQSLPIGKIPALVVSFCVSQASQLALERGQSERILQIDFCAVLTGLIIL